MAKIGEKIKSNPYANNTIRIFSWPSMIKETKKPNNFQEASSTHGILSQDSKIILQ
jgi:hypothetical protein